MTGFGSTTSSSRKLPRVLDRVSLGDRPAGATQGLVLLGYWRQNFYCWAHGQIFALAPLHGYSPLRAQEAGSAKPEAISSSTMAETNPCWMVAPVSAGRRLRKKPGGQDLRGGDLLHSYFHTSLLVVLNLDLGRSNRVKSHYPPS